MKPARLGLEAPSVEVFASFVPPLTSSHLARIDEDIFSPSPARTSISRAFSTSPTPTRQGSVFASGGLFSSDRFTPPGQALSRGPGHTPAFSCGSVSTFGGTPQHFRAYVEDEANEIAAAAASAAAAPTVVVPPAGVPTTARAATPPPPAPEPIAITLPPFLHSYLFYHRFEEHEIRAIMEIVKSIHPESNPLVIIKRLADVMTVRLPHCPEAPQWFYKYLDAGL